MNLIAKEEFLTSKHEENLKGLKEENEHMKSQLSSLIKSISVFSDIKLMGNDVTGAKNALTAIDKQKESFKEKYLSMLETQSKIAADSTNESRKKIDSLNGLKERNIKLQSEIKVLKLPSK